MTSKFDTPILFLIFNRPETTFQVFDKIKKVKPKKLYIASDGARDIVEGNIVKNLRDDLLNDINWDCEIETLFRDENLGCKYAVAAQSLGFLVRLEKVLFWRMIAYLLLTFFVIVKSF